MDAAGVEMTQPVASGRRLEALVATALIALAVVIFLARWSVQPHGLSAEQGEALALARTVAQGEGPRLTPASTVSPGPPNLAWFGVQIAVAALARSGVVGSDRGQGLAVTDGGAPGAAGDSERSRDANLAGGPGAAFVPEPGAPGGGELRAAAFPADLQKNGVSPDGAAAANGSGDPRGFGPGADSDAAGGGELRAAAANGSGDPRGLGPGADPGAAGGGELTAAFPGDLQKNGQDGGAAPDLSGDPRGDDLSAAASLGGLERNGTGGAAPDNGADVVRRAGDDASRWWLPRIAALLGALCITVVGLRAAWVWRRLPRVEDALPALGLSLLTALVEAAALGSGGVAWACFVAATAVVLGRRLGSGKSAAMGALIGAMTLFRPSSVWFLLAAAPAWAGSAKLEGRPALGEVARFVLAGAAVAGGVFLLRFLAFGVFPFEGLLPASAGVADTLEFVARQSRWFWTALAALLFAAVWRRFHLRGGGTLLAWVLATVTLACWTEQARPLFLGCIPLLAMLAGEGLSAARDRAVAEKDDRNLSRLAWLGLALTSLLLTLSAHASYGLGSIMSVLEEAAPSPQIDAELARRGVQHPLVAWMDGPEAAVMFPGARVVVIGSPGRVVEDLLTSEGPPDLVDGRVLIDVMPKLGASLTSGPGGVWWLVEQSGDDDPRCPDGRLALLGLTPQQLLEAIERDVAEGQHQRALSQWRCALAALTDEQLPPIEARRLLSEKLAARSRQLDAQGQLEPAVRVGALASALAGEPALQRVRVEQLRARWLE